MWKITILRKQIIFFPILGGGRGAPGVFPPGSAPAFNSENRGINITKNIIKLMVDNIITQKPFPWKNIKKSFICLGKTQIYGRVKPAIWDPTLPLMIIILTTTCTSIKSQLRTYFQIKKTTYFHKRQKHRQYKRLFSIHMKYALYMITKWLLIKLVDGYKDKKVIIIMYQRC